MYLTKAADAGNSQSSAIVGLYYYDDSTGKRDYNKAFKYLQDAAKNPSEVNEGLLGNVYRNLGACYRFGRGTEVNQSLASYYTEQAAQYGDSSSLDAVKMLRK